MGSSFINNFLQNNSTVQFTAIYLMISSQSTVKKKIVPPIPITLRSSPIRELHLKKKKKNTKKNHGTRIHVGINHEIHVALRSPC